LQTKHIYSKNVLLVGITCQAVNHGWLDRVYTERINFMITIPAPAVYAYNFLSFFDTYGFLFGVQNIRMALVPIFSSYFVIFARYRL